MMTSEAECYIHSGHLSLLLSKDTEFAMTYHGDKKAERL